MKFKVLARVYIFYIIINHKMFYTPSNGNFGSSFEDDEFSSEDEQDQITKYILSELLNDPSERADFDAFLKQGSDMDCPEIVIQTVQKKSNTSCKFGHKCRFLKAGTCTFSHEVVVSPCRYGAGCMRKNDCKFSH